MYLITLNNYVIILHKIIRKTLFYAYIDLNCRVKILIQFIYGPFVLTFTGSSMNTNSQNCGGGGGNSILPSSSLCL